MKPVPTIADRIERCLPAVELSEFKNTPADSLAANAPSASVFKSFAPKSMQFASLQEGQLLAIVAVRIGSGPRA